MLLGDWCFLDSLRGLSLDEGSALIERSPTTTHWSAPRKDEGQAAQRPRCSANRSRSPKNTSHLGLLNYAVPRDALDERVQELAERIAGFSPAVLKAH